MAAASLAKRLQDAANCSLCLDLLVDPVTLECGHNFCKNCILGCWAKPGVPASFCPACHELTHGITLKSSSLCPHCLGPLQQKTLKPNYQLGNLVYFARQLSDWKMKEAAEWSICERHQEPLKFFCMDDETPLCVVCERFKKHKMHHMVLVDVASEEYKLQIYNCLEKLNKKKEELQMCKQNIEEQSQDLFDIIEKERERIVASYRFLRQFLHEEEKVYLAKMEEVDHDVAKKRDEIIARLLREQSSLEKTIQELKEIREKPPRELLKDIKCTLQWCEQKQKETFEKPAAFTSALKWRVWEFWDVGPTLEKVIKGFEDTMKSESLQNKEDVILDEITVHPQLRVSEDGKCLTWCNRELNVTKSVERFVHYQGAMGSKCFQSGRHCWDVDVGKEDGWAVGICILPLQYNNNKAPGPKAGFWAMGKWDGFYRAVIHPHHPPLKLSEEPKKIRVMLNYMGHKVAFFDADTAELLYSFSLPDHGSSAYYPFFGLWSESCLRLESFNH